MDTININGQTYEVTKRDASGTPVIQGIATQIHHTDDEGNKLYDEEGNPKISVHISASPIQEPTKKDK